MKLIISPAKNMCRTGADKRRAGREPAFLEQTKALLEELRKFQPWDLEGLMKVNEKLAVQAFMDFQDMDLDAVGMAALYAYEGLVFRHIKADTFRTEELAYARKHVYILSAFYGILSAGDGIHPYRLEMMSKVRMNGRSLYQYWGDRLYRYLYQNSEPVVNLASEEYAGCIRRYLQPEDVFVDMEFLDMRSGKLKTVTAWAKMARGKMIRYAVQNQIRDYRELRMYDEDGYVFEAALSSERKYVFVRK